MTMMERHRVVGAGVTMVASCAFGIALLAQNPPPQQTTTAGTPQTTAAPAGQRGGGGGRGRGGIQAMALTTTAWADGAAIPEKYTQKGHDVSPPLAWANAPDTVTSFVLIMHDIDAPIAPGTDDTVQWMLWNIPGTAHSLPEGMPQGPQLEDGTRQISVTGPNYRGPGAPTSGPAHHYVFEIYALDATIDVPAVGAAPAATRAAVIAAMSGHVRGRGVLTAKGNR
jgi:Raf kinase inhibitor-like YbhB/YbcL family protein